MDAVTQDNGKIGNDPEWGDGDPRFDEYRRLYAALMASGEPVGGPSWSAWLDEAGRMMAEEAEPQP